jgi:hypothetical protein
LITILLVLFCVNASADVITLTTEVTVPDVKRIGINLGALEKWGPGHYLKNLVQNPGFESGEYNQLIPVAAAKGDAFQEAFWNAAWNSPRDGKPLGFWDGGTFEVMSGPSAGHTGTISRFVHEEDFRLRVEDLRHTFYVDPPFPKSVGESDIIRVHKDLPAAGYYDAKFTDDRRYTFVADARPDSPGKQSMEVHGRPAAQTWWPVWDYFMDSYGRDSDRAAGKMILFEGAYRIAFWAKADKPGTKFRVRLQRSSGEQFLEKSVSLTTDWNYYEHVAAIPAGADAYPTESTQPAVLTFNIDTGDAVVRIDDLFFGKEGYTNPTAFADEVVAKLKEYRPGVLRFWGNQLGAGLMTQVLEPYARGTHGHQPKLAYGGTYSYSLHEFLELCKEVGAEPWYVMPPTFSKEELRALVDYLAASEGQAYASPEMVDLRVRYGQKEPWTKVFKTIHIEYGNEMWGTGAGDDPFYGASVVGGTRLGQISSARFGVMKENPNFTGNIDLIVGGQAGWPPTNKDIAKNCPNMDTLAIAPYFGALHDWSSYEHIYEPLLASPDHWTHGGMVTECYDNAQEGKRGVNMAVYENNFHTTKTAAPEELANGFVAGFGGALALSRHSLEIMETYGVRVQCPFSFVGFSFPNQLPDHKYQIRLWGMLRDLLVTGRKRPTWLGVELANRAIFGNMVKVTVDTDTKTTFAANDVPEIALALVQTYAFEDADRYGVIVYNLDMSGERAITLNVPLTATPASADYLTATKLDVTNEDAETIRIQPLTGVEEAGGKSFTFTLPPTSVAALVFDKKAANGA